MNVPSLPFAVPVPVARMDREPAGAETSVFTSTPATEWNEHWVGLDVPELQRRYNRFLDLFAFSGLDLIE